MLIRLTFEKMSSTILWKRELFISQATFIENNRKPSLHIHITTYHIHSPFLLIKPSWNFGNNLSEAIKKTFLE